MYKSPLTLKDFLQLCKRYNIPEDATIELATGWECSTVEANELFYSIETNILYVVSEGVEDWFERPDMVNLKLPDLNIDILSQF